MMIQRCPRCGGRRTDGIGHVCEVCGGTGDAPPKSTEAALAAVNHQQSHDGAKITARRLLAQNRTDVKTERSSDFSHMLFSERRIRSAP